VAETLAEALEGHGLAMAFTRREGKMRRPFQTPRDAAPRILAAAAAGRRAAPGGAALVFGREDHGLSNADLSLCPDVVVIPSDPACASLNLAQAVAVTAYEIFLAAAAPLMQKPLQAAPLSDLHELVEHWGRTMKTIGFLDPQHPRRMIRYVERLFARATLTRRDVRVLRGLARQMEWAAGAGPRNACGIVAAPSKEPRQRPDGRRTHSRAQPPPQPGS
jgi:tRNA/rRNA methyltransferase